MQRTIGARELKTRLGAYLRQVRSGQTIVVTDRGEPVAELRPLAESAKGEAARLQKLVALGVLSRKSREPLKPFKPIRVSGQPLSATLMKEREDRV